MCTRAVSRNKDGRGGSILGADCCLIAENVCMVQSVQEIIWIRMYEEEVGRKHFENEEWDGDGSTRKLVRSGEERRTSTRW